MSLQAILDVIRAAGDAKLHELARSSDTQVREILANASEVAQKIGEEACAKAAAPADRERARILHRANLESLRLLGNVREELVTAALDQTRGRLANARNEHFYPAVLRRLVEETLTEFDEQDQETGQIELRVDLHDQALISRILSDMGLTLPIHYDVSCWGGLTAQSKDGKIVVVNTLEARLQRALPYLRRFLAAGYEEENDHEEASDTGEKRLIIS